MRSNRLPTPEALAWAKSVVPEFDAESCEPPQILPGAGSDRRLCRLFPPGRSLVLVENQPPPRRGLNENDSLVYLSGHLSERGLPVPAVYAYHRLHGFSLMEDFGDHDLYREVRAGVKEERLRELYREAVKILARMQTDGREGFDAGRCHSPARYDRSLMLAGESGYFQREFLGRRLGLPPPSAALVREFEGLAERAARAGAGYFLHRDFQSRNLKIHLGEIRIIDFQGARWGPPQYDLAALLLDPYIALPQAIRGDLMEHYLEEFSRRAGMDRAVFLADFPSIAVHRLMQALGAYSFLSRHPDKAWFANYIPSALLLLQESFQSLPTGDFPELGELLETARESMESRE
jgi:aminoglycoside/choline kinase family phosphotransferase